MPGALHPQRKLVCILKVMIARRHKWDREPSLSGRDGAGDSFDLGSGELVMGLDMTKSLDCRELTLVASLAPGIGIA
jgi:hypothetical protein